MFALSVWFGSGMWMNGMPSIAAIESAPSSGSAFSASLPSNAPAASVNPIGAAARWSWKLLT